MRLTIHTKIFCIFILFFLPGTVRSVAQTPDPGLPGTYVVTKAEYDLGDTAWLPPSFPVKVEVRGSVHYPTDLSAGPFPVVVFLHGRHETCYDTTNPSSTGLAWPCNTMGPTYASIVSYEGYDYVANTLASHGYIVISVSCNAINAFDDGVGDYGMQARGQLVQHHLDLWNTWNTTGGAPFGTTFVGKLDMNNIGTMGHSRGGEGVVMNALYNRSLGSPYGIKAVLTLAPVDFFEYVLNGIPLMNIAPYCDGDVSDIEGIHYYDDARYNDTTDNTPKHTILFMGANHNFFNTVWTPGSYVAGGADDWADYGYDASDEHCGTTRPTRFDTTKQKAALNAYLPAFFRLYLGRETQFAPILDVDDLTPPASSTLTTSDVYVSYHPSRKDRLDVNRTDSTTAAAINKLSGAVTVAGLTSSGICGGAAEGDCDPTLSGQQEPESAVEGYTGLPEMRLGWNSSTAFYENAIPAAHEDVSAYQAIQFRAAVDFPESVADSNLNFTVQLIDSAGNTSNAIVAGYSGALFFQKGTEFGDLPKIMLNTIKISLGSFTGVDMARIRNVKFAFDKSAAGTILITDLAFTKSLCGNVTATFSYTIGSDYTATFTNNSVVSPGDSVVMHWNFGDTLSFSHDTSSLQNPVHTFYDPGTFHVCLSVISYRDNGFVCSDTVCQDITIVPVSEVPQQMLNNISVTPNPAKDHLHITGASAEDILTLTDMWGRTVMTVPISSADIYLPSDLVTGIYYAVVNTQYGKVVKKILIAK